MTVRITWWGHATATVELGGLRLLTDPVLSRRLAHLRRIGTPAPDDDAGAADVVLVSHLHADHLHLPSLRRIDPAATLVVPAGGASLASRAWRGALAEARPGVAQTFGEVRVTAVPALHDGRRHPASRLWAPALGYVIEHGGARIWFAGDTGWFAGLADLAGCAPVDVALVPVGGWGPRLGAHHLDPDGAARAVVAVGAAHAVPIHYGTFWPVGLRRLAPTVFDQSFRLPGQRFAEAVRRLRAPTQVHLLRCGESVDLAVGCG